MTRRHALASFLFLTVAPATALGQLTEVQKVVPSDGELGDWYGKSVAIDGEWAVVGAYFDQDLGDNSGSVYVLRLESGVWVEHQKLVAPDGGPQWRFGNSVAIDAGRLAIGAQGSTIAGSGAGSVYIYAIDEDNWVFETRLEANDAAPGDQFGTAVDLARDTLTVGAPGVDDSVHSDLGAVYVLRLTAGIWLEEARLLGEDTGGRLGESVSLDGNQLAAGATTHGSGGINPGAAYVFSFDGTAWSKEVLLQASDGAHGDQFGGAVALEADLLVVGASRADTTHVDTGAAHVFRREAGVWNHESLLNPIDLNGNDYVGSAVSLQGGLIAVGADGVDLTPTRGAVYTFRYTGSYWANQIPLVASDGGSKRGRLGHSAALEGTTVLAGAFFGRSGDVASGAVYIYELPSGPGLIYCYCERGGCGGTSSDTGCPNSTGEGAWLDAVGFTRPDTIDFHVAGAVPNQFGVLFQGDIRSNFPFGGGRRCASGDIFRLIAPRPVGSDGTLLIGPSAGDPPISSLGGVVPGQGVTRRYQFWYRDPVPGFCWFNLTNGYEIVW